MDVQQIEHSGAGAASCSRRIVVWPHCSQGVAALEVAWIPVWLWTLAVILLVLWLLGTVTAYTMGGLIHLLLVVALVVVVVRLIQGRRIA
jgi:hypothetical protein